MSQNPGITKATEAAQAVGGLLVAPDFGPDRPEGFTDFNDFQAHAGAEAVRAAIQAARAPAEDDAPPAVETVTDEGRPRPQASVLVDIGKTHRLFNDDGEAYASVEGGAYTIQSNEYREILGREYYRLTGRGANRNALADAVTTLSAIAKYDGPSERVYLRVGETIGGIVLDAGTQDRGCIEITAGGWRILDVPPVHFRRTGKPLPFPKPMAADFSRLWQFLNIVPEHRVLVAGWLLAALRPAGPYPILLLVAEQGSGKSAAARILKALSDPSRSPLRAAPRDDRDLLVAAANSRVLALDNLSGLDYQTSDALCRLSTGGALSGRKLYTDSDETLIEVQRPAILNGIDDIASRPDLAERCLHVTMPPISTRRPEAELARDFERAAPAIFAALLDSLSMAIKRSANLDIGPLPRMADFAKWAAAGMPALGFSEAQFMEAYSQNQAQAVETGLESSAVGEAIRTLMENRCGPWEGSAAELLKELSALARDETTSRAWPRSPKGIVNALRRLAPALRHVGITWETARTAHSRTLRLCKDPGQASQASQVSPPNDGMTLMTDNQAPCTPDVEVF